ncbi:MAG: tRNA pseudouridine(38-40) synthase TruA [Clostridia bacterium]|nr:tRNA pseudouridine(38-40) synthase TruA [Clostridia bacterium]
MRNILTTIKYDGRGYHGWQVQENADSVQARFQEALYNVIGQRPDIKGCSRTDAGVHANMYCVSFRTEHTIPADRLPLALNRFLPSSIAAVSAVDVPGDFHARYSCKGKEYIYKILNTPVRDPFLEGLALHYWHSLDHEIMDKAARHFLGRHDFTSFCTVDPHRRKGDFHRTVKNISVTRSGDLVTVTIEADGFLYNMVRIIVGTLLYVSQGKIQPDDIPAIISSLDRSQAGPTAPPEGLYLNRVFYEWS